MRNVVVHHNDADGRCSAAIVEHMTPAGDHNVFFEYDHSNMSIDRILPALTQYHTRLFILDLSFPPSVVNELVKRVEQVVWIDHHASAARYVDEYSPSLVKVFESRPKMAAACELTWRFFHTENAPMPRGVKLISDYDCWRLNEPDLAKAYHEGVKAFRTHPTSVFWDEVFNDENVDEVLNTAQLVVNYRDNYCELIRDTYGFETEIDGHDAYAMNVSRLGSAAFGSKFIEYPICAGYIHDGEMFHVTLYSSIVDVSAYAVQKGGGGHAGAAGFSCKKLPFDRSDRKETDGKGV